MEFSSKNTGLGCHFLLQGILPTQGSNLHFLHWQILYHRITWEAQPSFILNFQWKKNLKIIKMIQEKKI